jgi:glucosylceramidase
MESAGNAWNVAFRNPDGSLLVVVVNDDWGTTAQRFNVSAPGRSFSYELPAGAVATFVLGGTRHAARRALPSGAGATIR